MTKLLVLAAYLGAWVLILRPPSGLASIPETGAPWWRDVRFWASVVIAVQMGVYAAWG